MLRGSVFDPACAERKGSGESGRSPTSIEGKVSGGLLPVVSEKNARFLQSEVHGIAVDDAIIRAYEGLDRAQGEELAVRLCRDAAERIAPVCGWVLYHDAVPEDGAGMPSYGSNRMKPRGLSEI